MLSAYSHFEPEHLDMIKLLLELEQQHLFDEWHEPGVHDDRKRALLDQLREMDANYPGGLKAYRKNAQRLIAAAQQGENTFAGMSPAVPVGIKLADIDERWHQLEEKGLANVNKLAVVMVAGGLGERLGYAGIKIAIPLDLVSGKSYLEHYLARLEVLSTKAGSKQQIPFVIMTSADTQQKTSALLASLGYGREIILLKQGVVPAAANSKGDFILHPEDPYQLQVKPHGHGDIHMLLAKHGLVAKWLKEGRTHTVFIQDTNGQVFNGILVGLGAALEEDADLNFLTVPREAGEKAGAITKLVCANGSSITCNVEYNEFDPLLRSTGSKAGDAPDPKTGKSPYPGNLNVFMVKNKTYHDTLAETAGIIAEFVNPKFKDERKLEFTPTRLETMMQDLARVMPAGSKVSFTNFASKRDVFSAVKNDLAAAAEKPKTGNYPDAMATGEADYYQYWRKLLALAGMAIDVAGKERISQAVPFREGAKIVLHPRFATSVKEVTTKINGGSITPRSVLLIEGEDVYLDNLQLDGTLIIRSASGVKLKLKDVKIVNAGWKFVDLTAVEMADPSVPDYLKIRGYKLVKQEQEVIELTESGEYELGPDLVLRKL